MKRCRFKAVRDAGRCWYCQDKGIGLLYHPDGSDTWVCKRCAILHGRIKKFINAMKNDQSSNQNQSLIKFNEGKNNNIEV